MGFDKSGVCGMTYSVVEYNGVNEKVYITCSYYAHLKDRGLTYTNYIYPQFSNPFDAYFWLLENVKGNIV
jgi:uncharacterized membrane protein